MRNQCLLHFSPVGCQCVVPLEHHPLTHAAKARFRSLGIKIGKERPFKIMKKKKSTTARRSRRKRSRLESTLQIGQRRALYRLATG